MSAGCDVGREAQAPDGVHSLRLHVPADWCPPADDAQRWLTRNPTSAADAMPSTSTSEAP